MINNNTPQSVREFHLDLCDVESTADAFAYALKMMRSLKQGCISNEQYDLLAGSLQLHCNRDGIRTKNELASLF
jgi:hypothetical protein